MHQDWAAPGGFYVTGVTAQLPFLTHRVAMNCTFRFTCPSSFVLCSHHCTTAQVL